MSSTPKESPTSLVRAELVRLEQQRGDAIAALDVAADAGDAERVSELQSELLSVETLLASARRRIKVHTENARAERDAQRLVEIEEAAAKIEKALNDDVHLIKKVDASLQALIRDLNAMIGLERSRTTDDAFHELSHGLPLERRLEGRRLLRHITGEDRLLLDYVADIIKRTLFPQNRADRLTLPSLPKIYADRAEKLAPSVRWWRKTAEEYLK